MRFKSQSAFGRVGNSIFRSWGVKALTFATLLAMASAAVAGDRIGRFCPDCMNEASAQIVAESMAPPPVTGPGCGGIIPLDFGKEDAQNALNAESAEDSAEAFNVCTPPTRRVFIVNHFTNNVFVFDVWTEVSLPNAIAVEMTPEEQEIVNAILGLRLAWDDFIDDLEHLMNDADLVDAMQIGLVTPSIQEDPFCPEGTALDVYLDPDLMLDALNQMQIFAEVAAGGEFDAIPGDSHSITGIGITASKGGGGFNVQWETDKHDVGFVRRRFDVSEHPDPFIPDRLTFAVNLLGPDTFGEPVYSINFVPEASRVAGMPLEGLNSGATLDPCVAHKLEAALDELGATYHMPPSDPTPIPFPTNIVPPGSGHNYCRRTMAAKVNGQVSYTFSVLKPCQRP